MHWSRFGDSCGCLLSVVEMPAGGGAFGCCRSASRRPPSVPSRVSLCSFAPEFLLDDPSIGEDFETFAEQHCGVFEEGDENKLEYTSVYNQFTELFNKRIEGENSIACSTDAKREDGGRY